MTSDKVTEKRFDEWINVKETLHNLQKAPKISEGEIWWCSMGENVGVEINGKNAAFSRPVFILKKLNRFGFLGIPLTSQPHQGSWYVSFDFQGKDETAVLSQARVLSVSRLYDRMGRLDGKDATKIWRGFAKLYLGLDDGILEQICPSI